MDFKEGDILLATKFGGGVVPTTPSGDKYGESIIDIDEDKCPHHKDENEPFTVQLTSVEGSVVECEWYTDEYPPHSEVHRDWINTLRKRGEIEYNPLGEVPDDFDPEEIEETTHSQKQRSDVETDSQNTWTETKSEVMSEIHDN